jgi:mannose-6-phosphate isomerase
MHAPVIPLWPNRVRRNYRGGYLLDTFEGRSDPRDGDCPEDWLASTARAVNPGMAPVADEGLAEVRAPAGEWTRAPAAFSG